jgi:hypothetical protein
MKLRAAAGLLPAPLAHLDRLPNPRHVSPLDDRGDARGLPKMVAGTPTASKTLAPGRLDPGFLIKTKTDPEGRRRPPPPFRKA